MDKFHNLPQKEKKLILAELKSSKKNPMISSLYLWDILEDFYNNDAEDGSIGEITESPENMEQRVRSLIIVNAINELIDMTIDEKTKLANKFRALNGVMPKTNVNLMNFVKTK